MQIETQLIDHEQTAMGLLELRRYEAETGETGYEILIDGAFLMATHGSHSERAMARIAWRRLAAPSGLCVLIGGLGAGHTLRAALDLPGVDAVIVSEIGRKVVDWNRRFFSQANGHAIDDPRVQVKIIDVLQLICAGVDRWHLMLLDVDNGPGWLASQSNAGLYTVKGLAACRQALKPGGVLAIWSPDHNRRLAQRLRSVFPGRTGSERTEDMARVEGEPSSVVYWAIRDAT